VKPLVLLRLKLSENQVLSLRFVLSTPEVWLVLTSLQVCHVLKKSLKEETEEEPEEEPEEGKKDDRGELHPLGRSPEDQYRRDDRKGELEDAEDILWDPEGIVGVGCDADILEKEELGAAEVGAERAGERGGPFGGKALPKDEAVADGPPDHSHYCGDAETKSGHREDILGADQTSVEEGQAGQGHQQHQGRGDHHPCRMAGDRHGSDVRRGGVAIGQGRLQVSRLGFQRCIREGDGRWRRCRRK